MQYLLTEIEKQLILISYKKFCFLLQNNYLVNGLFKLMIHWAFYKYFVEARKLFFPFALGGIQTRETE